eukprot:3940321-Pyramimonas_sp.AAC.1
MHRQVTSALGNRQGIHCTPAVPSGLAAGRCMRRRASNVQPQNGSTFCLAAPHWDAHKVAAYRPPPNGWANSGAHDLSLFESSGRTSSLPRCAHAQPADQL